jgi:hypothetical protein
MLMMIINKNMESKRILSIRIVRLIQDHLTINRKIIVLKKMIKNLRIDNNMKKKKQIQLTINLLMIGAKTVSSKKGI